MASARTDSQGRRGILDAIEWLGNRLPDPTMLFLIGSLIVIVLSQVGVWLDWSVQPVRPERVVDPATGAATVELVPAGERIRPVTLLDREGAYWVITSMVQNFINFPPLGIVLTGMLGVGVAERCGLIAALLKAFMLAVPKRLLTPTIVFLGISSSLATDAGYIVLPPLAAALFRAAGRSPLAGIAASFAGIACGFNANLLITSLDPLLAGLSDTGAQIIDPAFKLNPACNWWFMIASTILLTFVGWGVTAWFVEKRVAARPPEDGGAAPVSDADLAGQRLTAVEVRGMWAALAAAGAFLAAFLCLCLIPGAPLHGQGARFARWVEAIVPMIFIGFVVPGVAYGVTAGTIRGGKDVARLMTETIASVAPVIVLSFFAAQFIAQFGKSQLGQMLAMAGGKALAEADLGPSVLMVVFVLVTMGFNLLISSMSAKYAIFAPIFVPMFMMVGIHPALTQCAYRIGDSVTNIVTPLNAYLVVILAVVTRYAPRSGLGTLISMMVPYTVFFTLAWLALLLVWIRGGWELGDGGPLFYDVGTRESVGAP